MPYGGIIITCRLLRKGETSRDREKNAPQLNRTQLNRTEHVAWLQLERQRQCAGRADRRELDRLLDRLQYVLAVDGRETKAGKELACRKSQQVDTGDTVSMGQVERSLRELHTQSPASIPWVHCDRAQQGRCAVQL